MPPKQNIAKYTRAHEYLDENPELKLKILESFKYRPNRTFFYQMVVRFNQDNDSCESLVDYLYDWHILDVIKLVKKNDCYQITLKSGISAHVISKLPIISVVSSDLIPKRDRVPLVYVQGFPQTITDQAICDYFSSVSRILSIKRIFINGFFGIVLKIASVSKAIELAEKADREKYGTSQLTSSYQYKSAVTKCFFVNCLQYDLLSKDVGPEVSKFGHIVDIFERNIGSIPTVFIKMQSLSDAKLACGFVNKRYFAGFQISSVFIDPNFFDECKRSQ